MISVVLYAATSVAGNPVNQIICHDSIENWPGKTDSFLNLTIDLNQTIDGLNLGIHNSITDPIKADLKLQFTEEYTQRWPINSTEALYKNVGADTGYGSEILLYFGPDKDRSWLDIGPWTETKYGFWTEFKGFKGRGFIVHENHSINYEDVVCTASMVKR